MISSPNRSNWEEISSPPISEAMKANMESDAKAIPAYLVFDTESVPDGKLLQLVKYPHETLTPTQSIQRAQAEAKALSPSGSDFLPVTFQIPVAISVVRVGADFRLQAITNLGTPEYKPRKIVEQFWAGIEVYQGAAFRNKVRLVTFNGRGFDLPLMELAAFRYGISIPSYCGASRRRFEGMHLDLLDWLTNYSAFRIVGGLNLLSKLLGKPGKMEIAGNKVYELHCEGKAQEIADYCMFDTLDTYFVFLRTRVMTGEISIDQEHQIVLDARTTLEQQMAQFPALCQYLENWGDWDPWPS